MSREDRRKSSNGKGGSGHLFPIVRNPAGLKTPQSLMSRSGSPKHFYEHERLYFNKLSSRSNDEKLKKDEEEIFQMYTSANRVSEWKTKVFQFFFNSKIQSNNN
jgi:superoxide dismutase